MAIVYCDSDCVHCNEDEMCSLETVSIVPNEGCADYVCYTETLEYQHEYWIACYGRKDPKRYYREKKLGKRIEAHGMVFYTSDDDRDRDCLLTEARTGVIACLLRELDIRIDLIRKHIGKLTDVMNLPEEDNDA